MSKTKKMRAAAINAGFGYRLDGKLIVDTANPYPSTFLYLEGERHPREFHCEAFVEVEKP